MSHFNLLQRALGVGGRRHDIMLAVFDLLRLNGKDLRELPLSERRNVLKVLIGKTPPEGIVFSDSMEGDAGNLLEQVCAFGLEGVVSKRLDSPYRSGRREEWVKTKCVQSDEFIVIGYEPGNSYGGLGSLLLATAEHGKLVYAGGVGTGFNSRTGPAMKQMLDEIQTADSPVPGLKIKGAVWVRPEVIVEVEYRGITEDGQLRHPSFQHVRQTGKTAA